MTSSGGAAGFGDPLERPLPPGAVVRFLVGVAGLAFSITILWLSMRAVMGVGGACASGGPYVPAVECPEAVVLLTPLSIFGGLLSAGLVVWGGAELPGGWAGLVALAWPALFLSLGWNFLDFGLHPGVAPDGEPYPIDWSWLFCAVVFFVMGAGPLAVAAWGWRAVRGGRNTGRPTWPAATSRPILTSPRGGFALHAVEMGSRPAGAVADRLERLARLHAAGELTAAEFEAAKRATLDEAGA
jgi:hypothetical protein